MSESKSVESFIAGAYIFEILRHLRIAYTFTLLFTVKLREVSTLPYIVALLG